MIICILLLAPVVAWQAQIRLPVHVGEFLNVSVLCTNHQNSTVYLNIYMLSGYNLFGDVEDLRRKEEFEPAFREKVCVRSMGREDFIRLDPGATYRWTDVLEGLYRFKEPGNYLLRLKLSVGLGREYAAKFGYPLATVPRLLTVPVKVLPKRASL